VIHPEIWQHLKRSDVIVADVSGQNGNGALSQEKGQTEGMRLNLCTLRSGKEAGAQVGSPDGIGLFQHKLLAYFESGQPLT
jgi:hypothetical protein